MWLKYFEEEHRRCWWKVNGVRDESTVRVMRLWEGGLGRH